MHPTTSLPAIVQPSRKSTTSLVSLAKKDRPAPLGNGFKSYTLAVRRGTPAFKSPGLKRSPRSGVSFQIPPRAKTPSEDDMTGLPQFCTTCEKQIITPGNTILYCSEVCRRKDGINALDSTKASSYREWSSPLTSRHDSYFDLSACPDVIPKQSPTNFSVVAAQPESRPSGWAEAGIDPALLPLPASGHPIFADYGRRTYSEQSLPALSHGCASPATSPASIPTASRFLGSSKSHSSSAYLSSLRSIELVLPFTAAALAEAADEDHLQMKSCSSRYAVQPLVYDSRPVLRDVA